MERREKPAAVESKEPPPPEKKKLGKRWFEHDIARSMHAILLIGAMETGCAGSLRMERAHGGFTQSGVIELDAEDERRLIPAEIGPDRMHEEHMRVLQALRDMGVVGLDGVHERPINYDALGNEYGFPGGEISLQHDRIDVFIPSSYLLNTDEYAHEYTTAATRMTFRHEALHSIALDLRHTPEERASYRRGEIETTDPLAIGTDLHEAVTAFLTNALREPDDVLDSAYFDGQELLVLCAEGLRRDGVTDPIAFMARAYFNGGHTEWSSLVERSGRSLVQAGLIRDAHDLVVAIDRLPDPDILSQGSENALTFRSERFERETGYDLDRLPTDARDLSGYISFSSRSPSAPL